MKYERCPGPDAVILSKGFKPGDSLPCDHSHVVLDGDLRYIEATEAIAAIIKQTTLTEEQLDRVLETLRAAKVRRRKIVRFFSRGRLER